MRIRTNAKVNLFLKVLARRDDGYHDVDTIYHSVSLADEMELTASREGSFDPVTHLQLSTSKSIRREVDLESLHDDNLITSAVRALEARAARNVRARIRAHKSIPIGAGLAGGSANAAGTLVGLNELLELRLTATDLLDLATDLGSDVPFCIVGGTMRAIGRGERLMPTDAHPELWFVLGISDSPLATRDVYERWDEVGRTTEMDVGVLIDALAGSDVEAIGAAMHNDLQSAALSLRPELGEGLEALVDAGCVAAIVCGSGPTLLGLALGLQHARELAPSVVGRFDRVEVVQSVPMGIERLA